MYSTKVELYRPRVERVDGSERKHADTTCQILYTLFEALNQASTTALTFVSPATDPSDARLSTLRICNSLLSFPLFNIAHYSVHSSLRISFPFIQLRRMHLEQLLGSQSKYNTVWASDSGRPGADIRTDLMVIDNLDQDQAEWCTTGRHLVHERHIDRIAMSNGSCHTLIRAM